MTTIKGSPKKSVGRNAPLSPDLKNLAGFFDVLIQIDLANKRKTLKIDNNTK